MLQEKYGKEFPDTAVAYGWFSDILNVVNASETTGPLAHVFVKDSNVLRLGNDIVRRLSVGVNGIYVTRYEIEQTDKTQRVFAHEFKGKRYDVGNKFGWIQTNIEYGLNHPQVKDDLRQYLKDMGAKLTAEDKKKGNK